MSMSCMHRRIAGVSFILRTTLPAPSNVFLALWQKTDFNAIDTGVFTHGFSGALVAGSSSRTLAAASPALPIVVEMSDGELDVDIDMESVGDGVDSFFADAGGFLEDMWLFNG